ncbi:MAG: TetR family transcriptional regulator, partial [Pseudomonadota bacterium]
MSERSNKERILLAASKLLASGGLASLSVRAIATEAGLSTIAIYSHFQGKQGVLDALYIEGF